MDKWSLSEFFGLSKEKEQEILEKVRETINSNEEIADGGKTSIIELMEAMKDAPVEEGAFALLVTGRIMGMVERNQLFSAPPIIEEEEE